MTIANIITARDNAERALRTATTSAAYAEAMAAYSDAKAQLNALGLDGGIVGFCECNGGRFDGNCRRTDTKRYQAGSYGTAVLCPEHAHIAQALWQQNEDSIVNSGLALAQILRDERAMMRG